MLTAVRLPRMQGISLGLAQWNDRGVVEIR